jgi:aspartate kinase
MHTVEKIGGTSMSKFGDVLSNIIVGQRSAKEMYNRIFVVSAYGGMTDMLLEHKKSGQPGVYGLFTDGDARWEDALEDVKAAMCQCNASFKDLGLNVAEADAFVTERLDGIRNCMLDLRRLCSYGHFNIKDHLISIREMLSAVGEAHSARNSAEILKANNINAVFVDLSGWMDTENLPFDEVILNAFEGIDPETCMPIVTGYTKCDTGIMNTYDRGYSEITFSKIAVLTCAREGVIHKEFHLSSGDPKTIGKEKVKVIGLTNYDVADQLADLGMEAIHPRASKGMERLQIPIRVKNTFEPDHPGTLISHDYRSDNPRVEIITGCKEIVAIEVVDPDMVGQAGYDYTLLGCFYENGISYITKNTNANTITHYVRAGSAKIDACVGQIEKTFPGAVIRCQDVAIVSAIGSNMKVPGFLAKAAHALEDSTINILAMDQCMRQVNMQFVVKRDDFDGAVKALHRGLVENG